MKMPGNNKMQPNMARDYQIVWNMMDAAAGQFTRAMFMLSNLLLLDPKLRELLASLEVLLRIPALIHQDGVFGPFYMFLGQIFTSKEMKKAAPMWSVLGFYLFELKEIPHQKFKNVYPCSHQKREVKSKKAKKEGHSAVYKRRIPVHSED